MGNFNKKNRDRGGDRGFRKERPRMHETICSDCGKRCEVPFKPTTEKPVYCNDCFQNYGRKTRSFDRGGGKFQDKRKDSFRNVEVDNQYKEAINRLIDKMDVLISVLTEKKEAKKESKKTETKAKSTKAKETKTKAKTTAKKKK